MSIVKARALEMSVYLALFSLNIELCQNCDKSSRSWVWSSEGENGETRPGEGRPHTPANTVCISVSSRLSLSIGRSKSSWHGSFVIKRLEVWRGGSSVKRLWYARPKFRFPEPTYRSQAWFHKPTALTGDACDLLSGSLDPGSVGHPVSRKQADSDKAGHPISFFVCVKGFTYTTHTYIIQTLTHMSKHIHTYVLTHQRNLN